MLLNCCTLKIPVRNFGDVIDQGYKVIVYSSYYTKKLARSPPGTPKHQVYKKYVEKQPLMQGNPRQAQQNHLGHEHPLPVPLQGNPLGMSRILQIRCIAG